MRLISKSAILCLFLLTSFLLIYASPHSEGNSNALQSQPQTSEQSHGSAKASRPANARKRRLRQPTINDYIPCIFDSDQGYTLRDMDDPRPNQDDPIDAEEAQQIATVLNSLFANLQAKSGRGINADSQRDLYADLKPKFDTTTLANSLTGLRPEDVEPKVREWVEEVATTRKANTAAKEGALKEIDSIMDRAVEKVIGVSTHDRPDDVSCSFSLLDWKETKDVFGRRVANDYIAIQVNVRNLNDTNEFLIHDIQIAVDTGLNMEQFGRFQVGRDKLIVRGVAERGKSEDRRNLIINTLQTIGAISGGASAALTQATSGETKHLGDVETAGKLSTAVEIFQGAFITGLINIFPDHTLEQINHISDLAFSASSTLKTVVPRQGSVPLTTFLAEKPLEQLPFSRCGSLIQRVTLGEAAKDNLDWRYKRQPNDNSKDKTPGSPHYPFCELDEDGFSSDSIDPLVYTKPLHYKKWNPAALRILQQRLFVVVAGVHIQEVKNIARVDSVKCPTVLDGSVDLSARDKDGNISCTVLGNRLDRIASVKLGQGDKPVQFKPAQDGNSATLTFKADDFVGASGSLGLTLQDTAGKQFDSNQSLNFKVRAPKIDHVVFQEKTSNPNDNLKAILFGTNLDRIDSVTLTDSAKPSAKTFDGTIQDKENINASTTSITVIFNVKPADVVKPATVNFKTKDDVKKEGTQAKPQTVTGPDTKMETNKGGAAAAPKKTSPQKPKKPAGSSNGAGNTPPKTGTAAPGANTKP